MRLPCYYLTILRATRPPATNKAPAPKANHDATLAPPDLGSSALGAGGGGGAGNGAGAGAEAGTGGGAGAGFGAGAGAGFGAGGGGAGAGFGAGGGGVLQGALATTPPAFDSITPSVQSASAFAPEGPPAVAVLALASATTCELLWAIAVGVAAISTRVSIAASIINFFNPITSSGSSTPLYLFLI
jgi:hypothetical protein